MTPTESPEVVLQEKHEAAIMRLVSDVRCGKLEGSERVALATVDLLELVISESEHASALDLLRTIRSVGGLLVRALPRVVEPAAVTRRLLKAIRDDHTTGAGQKACEGSGGAGESLQRLVLALGARRGTLTNSGLGDSREHASELRLELESSAAQILSESSRLTAGAQLILAAGCEGSGGGGLLRRALQQARGARLLLLEGGRPRESHAMAARLCAAGADVTVTSLAAAAALMPRVNKVVVEAAAVLGGGGALAGRGARAVTAAARHYSVPVVCLSPLHRLCPLHACALEHLTAPTQPTQCLGMCPELSPGLDHIPPDHVTLFITNHGGSSPSYMYRLLSELYDPRDYQL